jgi:hypothetical protein
MTRELTSCYSLSLPLTHSHSLSLILFLSPQYDAIKKKIEARLQAIGNVSNETDELARRIDASKGRIDGLCIRYSPPLLPCHLPLFLPCSALARRDVSCDVMCDVCHIMSFGHVSSFVVHVSYICYCYHHYHYVSLCVMFHRTLQHDNLQRVLGYLAPDSPDIRFVCKYWTSVITTNKDKK